MNDKRSIEIDLEKNVIYINCMFTCFVTLARYMHARIWHEAVDKTRSFGPLTILKTIADAMHV